MYFLEVLDFARPIASRTLPAHRPMIAGGRVNQDDRISFPFTNRTLHVGTRERSSGHHALHACGPVDRDIQ
jgi:hypothetical protein